MERPEHIDISPPGPLKGEVLKKREAVKLIIIFHAVGLVGFLIPVLNPIFLRLVPWHLLMMCIILVLSHQSLDKKFIGFVTLVYLTGSAAEWIGVDRHLLFGDYNYGQTLGIQFSGVPLIIGINWFLLTYSAGALMQRSKLNVVLRIISVAVLLVLLDMLIEPVAIRFDYWHWIDGHIPTKNYICWFIISVLMLTVFELFRFKKQSVVAPVFLITQFIFFTILCFVS
jgi:putative membrane protein